MQADDDIGAAFANGHGSLSFNYRFEEVNVDGNPKNAHASTLRTAIDFRTAEWNGFTGYIQIENVSIIGDEAYNDGTGTSTSTRPIVADPKGTDLNQIYLDRALGASTLRIGRQEIDIHARFIGKVGWRQQHQSYDAISWTSGETLPFDLFYAYVDNVNRVFGDTAPNGDVRSASHLIKLDKPWTETFESSFFAYLLDLEELPLVSTATIGANAHFWQSAEIMDANADGTGRGFDVYGQIASQSDYGDNPNSVTAEYYKVEGGYTWDNTRVYLGQELLGSDDGTYGFSTPLATAHAQNGWADIFLNTPADGLVDTFVGTAVTISGTKLAAVYHDFVADNGNANYGTEIDLSATRKVRKDMLVGLKFASYSADDLSNDTDKFMFWVTWTPGA